MFNLEELKELKNILDSAEGGEVVINLRSKVDDTLEKVKDYDLCLWEFYWDCGRSGSLEGVFKASKETVEKTVGENAYFGEVLGKHSEVYGDIEEGDITLISDDPVKVIEAEENGFNPLDYIS